MENIKTLKQDNNKALAYLHNHFGFDFQKPVVIVKQIGKFTANSIKACLSSKIPNFSPDGYEIVLLIRPYDYCNKLDNLHAVSFDGKFEVDLPRGYSYDMDTFYNKADFEHKRKNKIAYCFVISQKKEYLCEKETLRLNKAERYIYCPSRYETCCNGNGFIYYKHINITPFHKNSKPFELDIQFRRLKSLSEIIDKSGYLTCEYRSELNRRVCAYKNKKHKAEFLATDYTNTVREIQDMLSSLKEQIADTVRKINNGSQARCVEKAVDKFSWALSYFASYKDRIAEKYYDSREAAENAKSNILGYIDSAVKALREAANETDGK